MRQRTERINEATNLKGREMDLAAIWTGLGSCRSRGSSILRQAIFFISTCQMPVFYFDYFYVMFMHSVILSGTNWCKGKLMYIISISLYRPQRFKYRPKDAFNYYIIKLFSKQYSSISDTVNHRHYHGASYRDPAYPASSQRYFLLC